MTLSSASAADPSTGIAWRRLLPVVGALGAAWNLFGIVQWLASLGGTAESLMAGGLTLMQAEAYLALPTWMNVVFAVSVFGGFAGSVALSLRHRVALPILAFSLGTYGILFAGDAWFGIFAAIPGQLAILLVVIAIAIALFFVARTAAARGLLR